jgi:hypothetical protein
MIVGAVTVVIVIATVTVTVIGIVTTSQPTSQAARSFRSRTSSSHPTDIVLTDIHTKRPRSDPGPLLVLDSLALVVEHEREFHINTEVTDRAVISKLDLVLGNPRTADSFD